MTDQSEVEKVAKAEAYAVDALRIFKTEKKKYGKDSLDSLFKSTGLTLRSYDIIHKWLRYNYGKAYECRSGKCEGKSSKYEWAKLPGKKYEKNIESFTMLCKKCHGKLDNAGLNNGGVVTANRTKRLWKILRESGMWAVVHKCCRKCGTTKIRHHSKGYCHNCYNSMSKNISYQSRLAEMRNNE